MNLVPILALIGSIFRGYTVDKIEIAGAALTIIALLCNNLWQRKVNIKSPPQFVRWGFFTYEQLLAIHGTYSPYIILVPSIAQSLSCTFLKNVSDGKNAVLLIYIVDIKRHIYHAF